MRIIAGELKGRKLHSPSGDRIRPTSDKVKGAIFSMIGAYVGEAAVLDVFSGSGNLGLEALSRGASRCRFCDNSRESVALIKKNVAVCGVESRAEVFLGDFRKALSEPGSRADVIFLDPPYREGHYPECMALIRDKGTLKSGGIVVAEHDCGVELPDVAGFVKIKTKRYGGTGVTLLREDEGAATRGEDEKAPVFGAPSEGEGG
ncbi:MAG: 16S rRNA (guanine(966)-N(2))-methyltransferase RsmD [Clostridiales Family XIII bacterium]|nr:16S rRNA (guanine(966)-N(2))-methyltransferase RsmD [Clostridiales Family XIII bacterium]